MSERSAELACPTCGPTKTEQHPRRPGVTRCSNCKEWLRSAEQACICPPCPGRGNDGHGMTHCAECCFGTGVEADLDCPEHGCDDGAFSDPLIHCLLTVSPDTSTGDGDRG